MKITIANELVEALDVGYDTNGNRRHVVHYAPIFALIAARTGLSNTAFRAYEYTLDAMREIGGKRYHNRKYGGGVAFTLNTSTLGDDITRAIDLYCRWYNSENVSDAIINQVESRMRHRCSVLVKSTTSGYIASGEYYHCMPLKIKCAHDHNLSLCAAPLKAALLWAAKAELKRWQLNESNAQIKILSDYTAIDANTRIYHYEVLGY